jgi:hypothetical protein
MITNENLGSIMGAPVVGPDDGRIGTVGQVFVNPTTGSPNWVTVHTGLFGRHESFVPLEEADWDREVLRIPYEKALVKDAPRIDTDEALDPQREDELYRYYGLASGSGTQDDGDNGAPRDDDRDRDVDTPANRSGDADDRDEGDAGGTAGDDDRRGETVSGSMRLRKYVVTEQQEVTVPVTREEVRLEPEPDAESDRSEAESSVQPSAGENSKKNQKGRHRA